MKKEEQRFSRILEVDDSGEGVIAVKTVQQAAACSVYFRRFYFLISMNPIAACLNERLQFAQAEMFPQNLQNLHLQLQKEEKSSTFQSGIKLQIKLVENLRIKMLGLF
ncbi:unnamed protein product, partial [Vitis vinifera]